MQRPLTVLALAALTLALLGSPLAAKPKVKGPEGVYWVLFPWEADFLPVGEPDGVPEVYSAPALFTFHADGTLTDTTQDTDSQYHAYWKEVGDHTILIKTLAVGRDWRSGLPQEQSPYTSEAGESAVTFSEDYETFEGAQWGKVWLCPPNPWGGPSNWQCPNPITTELSPEYETGPEEGFAFYGWRLPEP